MSDVSALEKQLTDAKELIKTRDRALKLYANADFKAVILDAFCVKECARYAQMSGDPALTAEQRADALALAQAAGHLRRFLSVLVQMGNAAADQLPDLELTIDEARAEASEE